MPDPQQAVTLEIVREALISHGGGFLRNVRWRSGLTCELCAGVPNAGLQACYNCASWIGRTDLADRLGFVTYAVDDSQSSRIMYSYKSDPPSQANRRVVALMHHYAVLRHWHCLDGSPLGPIPHWATAPSLTGRSGPHPLQVLADPLLNTKVPGIDLQVAGGAVITRSLRPQNFTADVPADALRRLVDDTWVGGGRAQSAAAALKRDGARSVTTLVVARWLTSDRGNTNELLATLRPEAFDPDLCPLGGVPCASG